MAINDISGLASSATAASLTFNQGPQRAGQQEVQIQAQSTGVENTAQSSQTAVSAGGNAGGGESDGGNSGGAFQQSATPSGSETRGTVVDITV
ncbi:MAG: hypothetical protein HOM25_01745 [Rhodospirillaceae bacterium]|jgi:hypothetical protein|nr:hypothetical protein [Rhodospirillaceae bacterium]MBT5665977.1 hypothetical protein [Rhodospirillaceae bacterium]MBT5811252.1 hypothetical protein [Rhodospirillaceae bacterium]